MILFKKAEALKKYIRDQKKKGRKIGYVPTMGALHTGHTSLIKASKNQCDVTVCSIFINPTQFNDPKDFEKYPVSINTDILLLARCGCDVLFLPPVKEIYPEGVTTSVNYDLGRLENILEGKYRPGHFKGVCQVVHKLLSIVAPDYLFLGQKDYQQCLVIKRLINQLQLPVKVITANTLREPSGLAMSSRNMRLSPQEKEKATGIFTMLTHIKDHYNPASANELENYAHDYLLKHGFTKVDYVSIVYADTLQPVADAGNAKKVVALMAAFIGEVRLIDNMMLTAQIFLFTSSHQWFLCLTYIAEYYNNMKKWFLNIFKYLLFLGLGVFLVWWSLHQIPDNKWNEFKAAFATAKYGLIVPVFFILFTSHVLRALRWKMLMQPLHYNPTFANTFFAVMIGYLANLAVPRLGEVLKCTILAKYEKVPVEKLMGTIVAERAFDVLCLALVFLLAFAFQFDVIGEYGINLLKQLFKDKSGHFSITRVLIIILIIVIAFGLIRFILRRFLHVKLINVVVKFVEGIGLGIISVKFLKQKWGFIFTSLGIWAMYLLGTWIGFSATAGTTGLPLEVAVSALAFASIGMILTPGGIGAYAFLMARVLEKNGVPFELGFANGTLQWFAQFIIIIFIGFISLMLLPYFNKTKQVDEKNRHNSQ